MEWCQLTSKLEADCSGPMSRTSSCNLLPKTCRIPHPGMNCPPMLMSLPRALLIMKSIKTQLSYFKEVLSDEHAERAAVTVQRATDLALRIVSQARREKRAGK